MKKNLRDRFDKPEKRINNENEGGTEARCVVAMDGVKLMDAAFVAEEGADCGRSRWRQPNEFYRFKGVGPETLLEELGSRLSCIVCLDVGHRGKSIIVQAAFNFDRSCVAVAEFAPNIQQVRSTG